MIKMLLWKGFSASLKTGKITKKIHINFRSYRSLFCLPLAGLEPARLFTA